MHFTAAVPLALSVVLAVSSSAAPIQDTNLHEGRRLTWKKVGDDAQKAGSTALKVISTGVKWYTLLKPREDQGATDLERRKVNWKKVAYTAVNDVIDVASTAADVAKAIKGRSSEPELIEAILRRALDLEERGVDPGSGAINWKKAGHTAGSIIKSALPLVPLFLREVELDELD